MGKCGSLYEKLESQVADLSFVLVLRIFQEFGIVEGSLLYVDDFLQTCKFYIRVTERYVYS